MGIPTIRLDDVLDGVKVRSPVGMTNAGDGSGRLFVLDQRGKVWWLSPENQSGKRTLNPTPFLDIASKLVSERPGFDERGLLGLAFHPNFAINGKLYVYYSAPPLAEGPIGPLDVESRVCGDD